MQEPQLHDDEEQKEALRADGDEKVLQFVPEAHGAQGSEVAVFGTPACPETHGVEGSTKTEGMWQGQMELGSATWCDAETSRSTLESQTTWRRVSSGTIGTL